MRGVKDALCETTARWLAWGGILVYSISGEKCDCSVLTHAPRTNCTGSCNRGGAQEHILHLMSKIINLFQAPPRAGNGRTEGADFRYRI